jgi:hypothetical protein
MAPMMTNKGPAERALVSMSSPPGTLNFLIPHTRNSSVSLVQEVCPYEHASCALGERLNGPKLIGKSFLRPSFNYVANPLKLLSGT